MDSITPVVGILMLANLIVTFKGFSDRVFADRFTFQVGPILHRREYIRLLSSAFLHVSWPHFFFNMLTLYFFGPAVEQTVGMLGFALIYFVSLYAGNLFSLYLQRHNEDYRAVGASGAISGVVFSAIALFPGMKLAFIFIPIPMPGWVFGLGYVIYSIYGIRSQRDNIGHEAHLGGGIAGLLVALALNPMIIAYNWLPIILIVVPTVLFLFFYILMPNKFGVFTRSKGYHPYKTIDDEYHDKVKNREKELNRILDKIKNRGESSLTETEKKFLEDYSDRS